jgi:anti-sigma factor RsiW
MKLTHSDELSLHRFLDGEMDSAQAVAFEARLAAEPRLRRCLEVETALRAGFAAAHAGGPAPRAGFTAGVLAAAHRLPSRQQLKRDEVVVDLVRSCRRVLIAAAVLFGICLAWHAGLMNSRASDRMEAVPHAEVEKEMKRLDALVEEMKHLEALKASGAREAPPAERKGK